MNATVLRIKKDRLIREREDAMMRASCVAHLRGITAERARQEVADEYAVKMRDLIAQADA